MPDFIDIKKNNTVTLQASGLVNFYRTMTSGATLPLQGALSNLQEMKSIVGGVRDQSRNTPLGMIITKPSDNSFFVGTAWEDWGDNGQHDEDLTLFTEISHDSLEFERMKPDDIRKRFPLWDGYHRGDKTYLK